MISLNNISKTYKAKNKVKTLALDNISFQLPNKGLIFILGKSGSGKSTLLNIIGGLDKADCGEIIIDNKSTKKFKSKDFDFYRNTYIGFIFQEFNLLEEYNVYDNILLSKRLQKETVPLNELDNLLAKVGIEGLGKRKTNELSGGEKQRVAIARALIKEPKIILADEPTGSLDQETGKQIFTILKEISQEKLVIVVSHDRESANLYADGILELQDGKIISNNIKNEQNTENTFIAKKSKLPFTTSLKFALLNLNNQKLKLFFTIILVFMSLVFFGTSKILTKFDIEQSHAKTMIKENEEYITISKGAYNDYSNSWYNNYTLNELTSKDLKTMQEKLNTNSNIIYKLNENNKEIGLDINFKDNFNKEKKTAYYLMIPYYFNFIEADKEFITNKIIGQYPQKQDEIMIHSYLADYIIYSGISLYNNNSENTFKTEYYKPASYEELLSEDKYLKLGSTKVRISGIILDEKNKFNKLKNVSDKKVLNSNNPTWLGVPNYDYNYYEFEQKILSQATDIYVAKNFTKNIKLNPNITLDGNIYTGKITKDGKTTFTKATYSYLVKNILNYNGETYTNINKLNDNEIIINETVLNSISNNTYEKLKEQYIKNYNDKNKILIEENKKIEAENNKLIEEYKNKINSGIESTEPILKNPQEIIYKSDEELRNEFIKNYLKENNIINSTVNLIFTPTNDINKNYTYENIKIIGINLSDAETLYMSNNIASKLMRANSYAYGLKTKSNKQEQLKNIFTDFKTDNSKYLSSTIYSKTITNISMALANISTIAFYASIIFGIFAFILLTNFIVNSIYYNKKTIGILRGLGARKTDVFKIFLLEGLTIGLFSLLLTIITLFIAIFFTNKYISDHLFFSINFITFTKENLLILLTSVIGIIFISSLFTVRKISKMNPVDAILNKN